MRMYIVRLNKEKITIPNCNQDTTRWPFAKGLLQGFDLYANMNKYKLRTMEETISRAFSQARWKKDDRWTPRKPMTNPYLKVQP